MLKKLSKAILIGLLFLLKSTEIIHGCEPDPVRNFMSGFSFVIGEISTIDETEILIDVADYFTSEFESNEAQELNLETVSVPSSEWRMQHFEQGDYVVVAFDVEACYWDNEKEVFHVTSLDYATLQVEDRMRQGWGSAERMLTDFINHQAAYSYQQRNSRIYRQHRSNPTGWLIIHDPTSLILGQITVLEWNEITIEIWDYVTPYGIELAFDRLNLHQTHRFNDFNVGDDVAVNIQVPVGDGDARTLTAIPVNPSLDILSVRDLDDGSIRLEAISEDSSASAYYTDLLQHRGNYPYVVTFGGTGRYKSVARIVDDELITVYEEVEVIEEQGESVSEAEIELLSPREIMGFDWLILVFVIVGIMTIAVVIFVVKIRK